MIRGKSLPGTPAPAHFWITRGGLRLAGDAWGEKGRQAVLLLHGTGQTRHSWASIGKRMAAAGYYVIAYDSRGHGDSDWDPSGAYGWSELSQDLIDLVRQEELQEPVLVGASMGGFTSLVAVAEKGLSASAIVLVDVTPHFDPSSVQGIERFMRRNPDGFATLDEVADAIARFQPHRSRGRSRQGLAKNVRLGPDGRYYWHWDPHFLSAMMRNVFEEQNRLIAGAAAIRCSSLLVQGGQSEVVDEAGAQAYLELCPHAERVVIQGARHMVAGDSNDCFGNAVLEFLQRAVPAAIA